MSAKNSIYDSCCLEKEFSLSSFAWFRFESEFDVDIDIAFVNLVNFHFSHWFDWVLLILLTGV